MGILQELAKRAALKTANMAQREIPTAVERTVGALVPVKQSGLQQAARALEEGKITRPITNNLEQTVESPSRRSFLKKAASAAARASVPDSIAEPLMSFAAKEVMTNSPEVVQQVAAAEGLSLKEALAAVTSRIVEHNKLAKMQEAARAEAGITDLIEGHQPVLKMLRSDSGLVDEGFDKLHPLLKKMAKGEPKLTKAQKLENEAWYPEYQSSITKWKAENPPAENEPWGKYMSRLESNVRWAPPHPTVTDDLTGYAMDLVNKEKSKVINTGWSDTPELTSTYVPGVGHYVEQGPRDAQYWLKSPDAELPEDIILHEYLNTMYKYAGE